jgi:hypothetical protein
VALRTLERVLAQSEPSEEVLAALQNRIEESEREPTLLFAFRGERAGQYQMLQAMRNGTFQNPAATPGKWDWQSILLRIPGVMATQTAIGIRQLSEAIEVAKKPPESWGAQFATLQNRANQIPALGGAMSSAFFSNVSQHMQRSHAHQRCAAVALAAERFRKKNNGWPNSLDELKSAGLLKEAPTDPYVGGNLKMKRTDDGLMIYAVGKDLTDDGGNLDWPRPSTVGTDVGCQLWDVAKRRQPAPPSKPAEDSTPP